MRLRAARATALAGACAFGLAAAVVLAAPSNLTAQPSLPTPGAAPASDCPYPALGSMRTITECNVAKLAAVTRSARLDRMSRNMYAWYTFDQVQRFEMANLPRVHSMADEIGYGSTLEQEVDFADLVVLARVDSIRGYTSAGTVTRLRVEQVAKGRAPQLLDVLQDARVEPILWYDRPITGDEKPALIFADGDTPMLAGDRVILMLRAGDSFESMPEPMPFAGTIPIQDGAARTVKLSPFHDVDGWSPERLMQRAAARAAVHPWVRTSWYRDDPPSAS